MAYIVLNVLLCFFVFVSSLHHYFFGANLPFSLFFVVVTRGIPLRKKLTLKLPRIALSMDDITVEDSHLVVRV